MRNGRQTQFARAVMPEFNARGNGSLLPQTTATTGLAPGHLDFDMSSIPPNSSFRLDVEIVGHSAVDETSFFLSGLFHVDGSGVIAQTGPLQTPAGLISTAGASGWTGSLTVTGTNHVTVLVIGAALTAVGWASLPPTVLARTGTT